MRLFDPTRKEFYRTPKYNFLYSVLECIAILPAAILIWAVTTNHLDQTPFIGGLFSGSFCMAISIIGIVLNQKIVVSRKGIEYHVGWSRVEASWKDIEKIALRWDLLPRTEGLLIPKTDKSPLFLSKLFIPLSLFADNWRDSELGGQIKQYVPHLFEPSPLERTSTN